MPIKVLTANDLVTGAVVWWTGTGWSRSIAEAVPVGPEAVEIGRAEEAARRIVAAELIDCRESEAGPRPLTMRERVRALGPSVHPHFGPPADGQSGPPADGRWTDEPRPVRAPA